MKPPSIHALGCIFLALLVSTPATTVTADGRGATETAAKADAQRNAIQKAVGVYIASETLTKNFMLAKDVIFSKAEGFVKTYKVLKTARDPDGMVTVSIEADVDAAMDNLLKDEAAVDLLLQWVNRPKFMVLLNEKNARGERDMVAETQIIKKLREMKFQVVDPAQIEKVLARDKAIAELEGDPSAAAALAARFGAQILVTGSCEARVVSHPALGSSLSGQANISGRIVNADNAEIVATDSWHGKFVHIDSLTAGKRAALEAADGLVNYLIGETVKTWGQAKANAVTIQLTITGMEYPHKATIATCLQHSVEGITEVTSGSFSAGVGEYQVKFAGTADDLGGLLYGKDCGGVKLLVYEQTGNTIKLKIEK